MPYNEQLCNERHEIIDRRLDKLSRKLDWATTLLIITLVTLALNLVFDNIKYENNRTTEPQSILMEK